MCFHSFSNSKLHATVWHVILTITFSSQCRSIYTLAIIFIYPLHLFNLIWILRIHNLLYTSRCLLLMFMYFWQYLISYLRKHSKDDLVCKYAKSSLRHLRVARITQRKMPPSDTEIKVMNIVYKILTEIFILYSRNITEIFRNITGLYN